MSGIIGVHEIIPKPCKGPVDINPICNKFTPIFGTK